MSRMPYRVLNPALSLVLLAGLLVVVARPAVSPGQLRPASLPGAIGEKSVDAMGAYRREIPLRVPSFFGIEPALRLSYSTQSGNGLAGVGWTLSGFAEITRSSPNLGAPTFTSADVFHLDGAELVACTPAMTDPSCRFPAAPGQVAYAARSADYRRIAFEPTQVRWLVWERGGAQHVFTEEAHSGTATPSVWALTSTTDPEGHQVTYTRKQNLTGPDTASYPFSITYGGVTVTLYHQARPDPVTRGDGRALVSMQRRLRTVSVAAHGAPVRMYRLSYDVNDTTGESFLSRFEEFGSNVRLGKDGELANPRDALPLPATTFAAQTTPKEEWSSSNLPGLGGLPTAGGPRPPVVNGMAFTVSKPYLLNAPPNLGDVDGNGRTDWVQATPDLTYNSSGDPMHTTLLITAVLAGKTAPIYTQTILAFPFAGIMNRTYLSDVDGDGRADLVFMLLGGLIAGTDPNMDFRSLSMVAARSLGDGSFTWLSMAAGTTGFMSRNKSSYRRAQCAPGDIDGDRRGDVLCSYTDDSDEHHLGTARANGDGTWTFTDTPMDFPAGDGTRDMVVGDTNGDRFADAMFLDYPACPPTGPCEVDYILTTGLSDGVGGYNMVRQNTDWRWGNPNFFAADINGDRRADYVLFASVDEQSTDPGAIQTALSNATGEYTLASQEVPVALRNIQHSVSVGDFDGDLRADLMVVSQQPGGIAGCGGIPITHLNLHRVRSLGDGTFDLPSTWLECSKSVELNVPWTDMRYTPIEPEAADLDGDGADDFLIAESPRGTDVTTLHEDLSANPDADTHAWQTGEFNGDGLADWVFVRSTTTGPLVAAMLSNPAGGFTGRGHSPPLGTSQLTAQAGWRIADIDADGLDDLLYLRFADQNKGIEVSSWITQGNGTWVFRQEYTHQSLTGLHRNVDAWRVADLNGDRRSDLVYVDRDGNTGGLKIWTSLSNGDGTWTEGTASPTGSWPGPDGTSWRVADLNGDGRHDLVHIGIASGSVQTQSLLSSGNGQFAVGTPATISGPDLAGLPVGDLGGWSVAEANGDGLADLVHLSQTTNTVGQPAQVRVLNLLGHGDGGFTSRRDEPTGTFIGDLGQWRGAISSVDGRTDMVHVRNDNGRLTVTALRPSANGRWNLTTPLTLPGSIGTIAGAFATADADGDGETDLVRFDLTQPGMRALTIKAGVARAVITKTGLNTGGSEEIDYAVPHSTGGGATCALPAGVAPLAVSTLRQSAGPNLGSGQANFYYTCPRWSPRRRALLGWEYVTSFDGPSQHHPGFGTMRRYDLTEACPARLALEQAQDGQGNYLRKEITAYKHTGNSAPYNCLVDNINRVTAGTSSSLNSTIGFIYDAYGNVTSVLENGGGVTARTTNISYAPLHSLWVVDRPWQVTVREGQPGGGGAMLRSIFHCYDGFNGTDQANCPSTMTLGRLTAIKLVNANGWYDTTTYAYNGQGNISAVTDADNRTTTISYDPMVDRFPRSVCDALNHCTTFEWYHGIEQIAATIDANTARTDYGYDVYGRLRSVSSPAGTRTMTRLNEGDPEKQRLRTVEADGTTDGLWSESYFDGLGRLYERRAEGPTAADPRVQSIGYDDASPYPARRGHWHFASVGAVFEGLAYDAAGRLASQTHPDGAVVGWSYSASLNDTTTKFTDEENLSTQRAFDGYDRVRTAQADPGGPAAGTIHFSANAVDELRTITDPLGNTVVEQIDPRGDIVGRSDPDRGDFTAIFDRTGHLKQRFPQSGGYLQNWYDTVGRKTMAQLPSYRTINWLYDEANHGASAGRLTAITDTNGMGCPFRNGVAGGWVVDERSYNLAGRVTSRTLCVEGESKTFGFDYDAMGRQRSITYPDGETVIYRYNDAGQLLQVDGYVDEILYDAAGRITKITYQGGTYETFAYHPLREWLELHRVVAGGALVTSTEYQYHRNGQLRRRIVTGTNAGTSTYVYDSAGRLKDVTGVGPGHYEYDAAGDMTTGPDGVYSYTHPDPAKNRCGGTGGNTCPHAVKKVGASTELTYNLRGEVTQISRTAGGVTTRRDIGWNPDGEPTTFSLNGSLVSTVQYGLDGERTSVASGQQKTRYFGGYLEVTRPTPGAPPQETKSYYAGAVALAQKEIGGDVTYNHHDTLGSTTLVTSAGGTVVAGYTYDGYGRLAASTGFGGDQRYAGHKPVELGLIHMGARLYDPQLGRFLSPDPKRQDPRQARPADPFSYADNDPVNLVDPDGHQATRNWTYGAHGSGVLPGAQPSQADLDTLNTWINRSDPAMALPTPRGNAGVSRNGGACSMCHGNGDYYIPRDLTTGEKIALGIVAAIAVIVIVVALAPEIAAAGAAVGAVVTAIDAIILRASIWIFVQATSLIGLVMAMIREGVSSGGGIGNEVEQVVEEVSRMRLDYHIFENGEYLEGGTIYSCAGGDWGHCETQFAEKYMGLLGPEHDVFMQGEFNMCGHGQCRVTLSDMAIMDGPNMFYIGYSFQNMPQGMGQQFVSGVGFVYAPRR
ncbi:hypothetical protein Rhe02_06480 [Rhizocola hellebori]|uniref:Insecticide toxin TcdB middle/N-terminal domain-containing protein n=1 Tax=Rhizocola hellebori TaxID=1392758 RepID=A0A8J3Q2R0_9ACTN|nr:FG-GAP-like repeat-containing protein [Rhizocola hellebori]GIH02581.1 hypothetical protein Rhe02_06480 [Rhizocola hellebori]